MAPKNEQKANQNSLGDGHIRVRVIELDIHGGNQTLAEGMKALTTALTRNPVVIPAPAKTPSLPAAPKTAKTVTTLETETAEPATAGETEVDDQQKEAETTAPEGGAAGSNGNSAKREYNYKPPVFLNDLDLSKATKPLADFIAEKGSPTETNDRYIVVAVWLKDHMAIEEFTINHIYTAFDSLGWKGSIPVNHSQPLRDLKTKRHFLTKEKGAGYKVNWNGIQYVEKMGTTA